MRPSAAPWIRAAAPLLLALLAVLPRAVPAVDLSGVWWIHDRSELAAVDHAKLPLRPEAAALYRANRAAVAAGRPVPLGAGACLPPGMPRLMLARYPIEILQRPELVTILHERMHLVRFLYLDRGLRDDPEPSFDGESVAHWEGGTLVAQTIGLRGDSVLDASGIPHSDALRLGERFSLAPGGRRLHDVVTVEDDRTFTHPWSFRIEFDRHPEQRLMEDVCSFGPPQRDAVAP